MVSSQFLRRYSVTFTHLFCFKRPRPKCSSLSARKQLNDLLEDALTKVTLFYYSDSRDALIKGLAE